MNRTRRTFLFSVAVGLISPAHAQQPPQTITLQLSPSDIGLLGGSLQYACPALIQKLQEQINASQKPPMQPQVEPSGIGGTAPPAPPAQEPPK